MSGPARLGSCVENPSEARGQPRASELCRVVTFFFFFFIYKTVVALAFFFLNMYIFLT